MSHYFSMDGIRLVSGKFKTKCCMVSTDYTITGLLDNPVIFQTMIVLNDYCTMVLIKQLNWSLATKTTPDLKLV